MNVSILQKVCCIIICIDANDNVVLSSTASDKWQCEIHGAVPMVPTDHSDSKEGNTPCLLLDGGNQFDDIGISGSYIDNGYTITLVILKVHHSHGIGHMIWLPLLVSLDYH